MTDKTKIVVLLKGYPRLSETFIAQELLGLERAGLELHLASMRHPTDKKRHPVHDEIKAPVFYLPEYLHQEPLRVLRGLWKAAKAPGFGKAFKRFLGHLPKDFTRNRIRRFGQAAVLVAEWPDDATWLYAHFIHTPASVALYASEMMNIPWSISAHAKDIWTSDDWDLAEKLTRANWTATCTKTGHEHLQSLAEDPSRVHLSYHGLDLDRFEGNPVPLEPRDGSDPANPVVLFSVGRLVEKKGYDTLLEALSLLPKDLNWRFDHAGHGPYKKQLVAQSEALGIADKINWMGAVDQKDVLAGYRACDIFTLACKIAADGDRDGLPNVLVEAASQQKCCVATRVSAIPELFRDNENGLLVEPEQPEELARALERAIVDPALRVRLGAEAERDVRKDFDHKVSVSFLKSLFIGPAGDDQAHAS